jgi:hypothetical protein
MLLLLHSAAAAAAAAVVLRDFRHNKGFLDFSSQLLIATNIFAGWAFPSSYLDENRTFL